MKQFVRIAGAYFCALAVVFAWEVFAAFFISGMARGETGAFDPYRVSYTWWHLRVAVAPITILLLPILGGIYAGVLRFFRAERTATVLGLAALVGMMPLWPFAIYSAVTGEDVVHSIEYWRVFLAFDAFLAVIAINAAAAFFGVLKLASVHVTLRP